MKNSNIRHLFLAGEYQGHITTNVFNVLAHGGFLRDQGILSLESVQLFYKLINRELTNASMITSNLLDFCDQYGEHELSYQPVIRLTIISSSTGESQGHAIVLHSYNRTDDFLILSTIDSASPSGYTSVVCPILTENGQQRLLTGPNEFDKMCLASEKCYYIHFN